MKAVDKKGRCYLWVTKNPLGTEVALTQETYETHILRGHPNDKARKIVYPQIKGIIEQPRFIYYDQQYEENLRHRYLDFIHIQEYGRIFSLVIIVDTDRSPNEIVTWHIESNKNRLKTNGVVIYDSRQSNRSYSDLR